MRLTNVFGYQPEQAQIDSPIRRTDLTWECCRTLTEINLTDFDDTSGYGPLAAASPLCIILFRIDTGTCLWFSLFLISVLMFRLVLDFEFLIVAALVVVLVSKIGNVGPFFPASILVFDELFLYVLGGRTTFGHV